MREVVLFDIDGTLFNPREFGKRIRSRFTSILSVSEDELVRANADYYAGLETTTDFNPQDIVVFIANRFGGSPKELSKVFWEEDEIYEESLYEEAKEVLAALFEKYTLGIYSQGFAELQKRKLSASGIDKYFKEEYMFFHRRKISDSALALLPDNATVVDDNLDVVRKIAPFVEPIWVNREGENKDSDIKTITNLKELIYLI